MRKTLSLALALAGYLALPAPAAAQMPNPLQLRSSRVAVTPFGGVQVPYVLGGVAVYTQDDVYIGTEERAGGPMAGAEIEVHAWGPLSVLGTVAYSNPGFSHVRFASTGGDQFSIAPAGPNTLLSRVALSYRLPEPEPDTRRFHPAAFLLAGPAMVRTSYSEEYFGTAGDATQWAANVGLHGATTLGSPRVALHFGLEDYITFWNTERSLARDREFYGQVFGEPVEVAHENSVANLLIIRAGLSLRF